MLASLPQDASSSPQLRTSTEVIALAAHASMLAVGFRLVGLGEEHRIDAQSDPEQPQPLPREWSVSTTSDTFAFRYKHSQSSMEFLVKIIRMFNRASITGMGLGDDRMCSFTVLSEEYVMKEKLPFAISSEENAADGERSLAELFTSVGRLSDLGSLMRINVIQKLLPSLQKEGYEETTTTTTSGQSQSSSTSREPPSGRERDYDPPRRDPLREDRDPLAQPWPPAPQNPLRMPGGGRPLPEPIPGFEDEFELQRPARGGGRAGFGGPLHDYGRSDLYPPGLGPNDPMRGGIGPGFGGPMGGGGMHPDLGHFPPGDPGRRGGGGYNPQAPPGSRFDPVGPGLGGPPRGGPGMGGRPPNPFGGYGSDDFI